MGDCWKSSGRAYRPAQRFHQKQHYTPRTDVSTVPAPPLGKLIQSLDKSDLEKDAERFVDKASIQDCSLVASYNWLGKTDPTVVIPGQYPSVARCFPIRH